MSYFQLREHGTDVKTEIIAGTTTFMTMSYILVVNPQILSGAGLPFDAVLFATATCSAVATLVMALWARYPIALAPGMGLNAYFALVVAPQLAAATGSKEGGWQAALGAVFFSGVLFLLLSLFRLREAIVNGVPSSLKMAISGGIGLFIALIGFQNGGLIEAHPVTLITAGDVLTAKVGLTLLGVLIITALMARGVGGAALIGMATVSGLAMLFGQSSPPASVLALPAPSATFFALDIKGAFSAGVLNVIFAFFFVDLFDTIGTLIGVAEQGGFLDDEGHLPRANRALLADAIGTLMGALLGTSTVTSYIESASGIAAGGRTGLSSLVTASFFLLALFFAPVFRVVPPMATAPVLIIVGALMVANVRKVPWDDTSEAIPAFLTLAGIAFSYSIADGMALGFVSYATVKALAGRAREVGALGWVLALLFLLKYLLLAH